MGKETKAVDKDYWSRQVASWEASGLSQSAYCRQAGIGSKKFHYHMHRLKKETTKPALRFIEAAVAVKAVLPNKKESQVTMRLILPNGIEAIVEAVSFDLVPRVLEMARGLS